MIAYEELVAALARWRARRGLPTGPGDYLGEPAPGPSGQGGPPGHWPARGMPAAAGHGRDDDLVELGDETVDGFEEPQPRTPAYGLPERGFAQSYRGSRGAAAASIDAAFDQDEFEMEFGDPADEATRPAGLAGTGHPSGKAGASTPAGRQGDAKAESRPPGDGRGRGRQRRK